MDSHVCSHRATGVVLMGLLFGVGLFAQPPKDVTGWGKLTWNMSFPQVKAQYPNYKIVNGTLPKFVNGKEVGSEDNPDELIIQDFDINGIPVDICVYGRPNKNTISGITLNPNLDKSPLSVLDTTYGVFKRLLMSKYGAPNEERTPEE